jgi:hypothetical protein
VSRPQICEHFMAVDRQGGTPVFGAETAHKLLNPAMP